MNIFITGTDTDVGKTFIAAGLATVMQSLNYQVGVFKPIQCGAIGQEGFLAAPDLAYVKRIDPYVDVACSYLLKAKASPSIAAELEHVNIDIEHIVNDYKLIKKHNDVVITEGAGGLMSPITSMAHISDIAKAIGIPLLIIIRPDIGAINHALMTINQAKALELNIIGVIINKYPTNTSNIEVKALPRLIEEYSDAKILGIVPELSKERFNSGNIVEAILNNIDIEKVFSTVIPKLSI